MEGSSDHDGLKNMEAIASELGDGNKAIASSEAQPSGAPGKKKKKVRKRLKQEVINEIKEKPFAPIPEIPQDKLAKYPEKFRAAYDAKKAIADRLMAYEADILEQYEARGYAEVEEEVTDNEDDKVNN